VIHFVNSHYNLFYHNSSLCSFPIQKISHQYSYHSLHCILKMESRISSLISNLAHMISFFIIRNLTYSQLKSSLHPN
jgi:hypothetical protein